MSFVKTGEKAVGTVLVVTKQDNKNRPHCFFESLKKQNLIQDQKPKNPLLGGNGRYRELIVSLPERGGCEADGVGLYIIT